MHTPYIMSAEKLSTTNATSQVVVQQRVQHRQVEQLVEVPIPQIEEEIVHVPKIITQQRVQHEQVEQIVEVPVPMMEEEVVHVPKIITQTRVPASAG